LADDPLSRLGLAIWRTLESWVGRRPLRLVAMILIAILWVVSTVISAALVVVLGILRYLLITYGIPGEHLVRLAALGPSEVQRALLWGLAAVVVSWWLSWLRVLLSHLQGLLLPTLRWVKLFCFLGAFLHIAMAKQSPTVQAGQLLGLWVFCALLGRLVGTPKPNNTQLDVAVRVLEWKVEELQQRLE
ncbi:TM109 protein, partial [Crotophaga sulcirostris]|nr:TM109 protein [Crotophaga sulcirostris]